MTEAVTFLHAFAQAMSALSLYPEGHTSREKALDTVMQALFDLLGKDRVPVFSFLGDEVVYDNNPLREFRDWDWSHRLAGIGIQRLEFDETGHPRGARRVLRRDAGPPHPPQYRHDHGPSHPPERYPVGGGGTRRSEGRRG